MGQLNLRDQKLGEKIIARIDGQAVSGEAALWAAFAGEFLGATLKATTLEVLQSARQTLPVQWFALMRDTQAVKFVEIQFIALAKLPGLNASQAVDLVRAYKRWATENRLKWNVTLSGFLSGLPDDVKVAVSGKIVRSLGPSFAVGSVSTPAAALALISGMIGAGQGLYDRQPIQSAMEKVVNGLDLSLSRAREMA